MTVFLKKIHYLRDYGAEAIQDTARVLALRLVSPDATRSDRVCFVGTRYAGTTGRRNSERCCIFNNHAYVFILIALVFRNRNNSVIKLA